MSKAKIAKIVLAVLAEGWKRWKNRSHGRGAERRAKANYELEEHKVKILNEDLAAIARGDAGLNDT